uniref:ATP synthase subunit b', chloroplastic n=1 Tax=Dipterocladia arabiensis TaxID=2007176 RepID=A0A1Z1M065_9FLOR|nr:ATP synthase CF0 subunit II [Dipterocladia arabiensis]ARW59377.1 ATP synthase CF0 subunit II [Dipterocladia arabiensis]
MYNLLLSFVVQASDIESQGGLFDFNATLPLMALQFLVLTIVLNLLFYKPVSNILDQREEYIRNSLTTASASLVKADELTRKYEYDLAESRKNAQDIIKNAQQQAQLLVSDKIKEAQKDTEKLLENAYQQLNTQKDQALKSLETQVDILSDQIKLKLLDN